MGGVTRSRTAEPTLRDQSTRQERGQRNEIRDKVTKRKKYLVRKRRRRGRAEPCLLRQNEMRNRARARRWGIIVVTHNLRTMAVDGTHGVGRALEVLSVFGRLGCDVIGVPKTCRSRHSAFTQTGYLVYCSGECGGESGGMKGPDEVRLAPRTSITRAARPPEFINDLLLKVTLELRGRAKAFTFFVVYASTETKNASKKHAFWTTLGRAVEKVPKHKQKAVRVDGCQRTHGEEEEVRGWGQI